jgi:hypothetical protein
MAVRRVLAAWLAACALAAAAQEGNPLSDINYRLGDGLHIPGTGLTLGGYATAIYERPRGLPARAALDDLSVSLWWDALERWRIFSEFDLENVVSSRSSRVADEDRYLALERFYIDYALNETTTVRIGKFLTPIGRWNLAHATPLVWTTSRPLVTIHAFPTNVTGLMVSGSMQAGDHALEYSVFGSNGREFRPSPTVDAFHEALGAHLAFAGPSNFQWGVSFATFDQATSRGDRKQLVGVDFVWSAAGYELSLEAVQRLSAKGGSASERGGFVQLVAPVAQRLFVVGRFETYRPAQQSGATRVVVAGLNYRVTPAAVFKLEWVHGTRRMVGAPEGLLSSFSVLF